MGNKEVGISEDIKRRADIRFSAEWHESKEINDAIGALKVMKVVIDDDDDTISLSPINLGYGA